MNPTRTSDKRQGPIQAHAKTGAHEIAAVNYFVAMDCATAAGPLIRSKRLSRQHERLGVCRRVLKRIKRAVPAAFMVQETIFR